MAAKARERVARTDIKNSYSVLLDHAVLLGPASIPKPSLRPITRLQLAIIMIVIL
jgi:hypothetical protein